MSKSEKRLPEYLKIVPKEVLPSIPEYKGPFAYFKDGETVDYRRLAVFTGVYEGIPSDTARFPEIANYHAEQIIELAHRYATDISPNIHDQLSLRDIRDAITYEARYEAFESIELYHPNLTTYFCAEDGITVIAAMMSKHIKIPQVQGTASYVVWSATAEQYRGHFLRTCLMQSEIKKNKAVATHAWRMDVIRRKTLPLDQWKPHFAHKYGELHRKITQLCDDPSSPPEFSEHEIKELTSLIVGHLSMQRIGMMPVVHYAEEDHLQLDPINYLYLKSGDQWKSLREKISSVTGNYSIYEVKDEDRLTELSNRFNVLPDEVATHETLGYPIDHEGEKRVQIVIDFLMGKGVDFSQKGKLLEAVLQHDFSLPALPNEPYQVIQKNIDHGPPDLPIKPKPRYSKEKVEQLALEVQHQFEQQLISKQECEQQLRALYVTDADGNIWSFGATSHMWHMLENSDWVEATPPENWGHKLLSIKETTRQRVVLEELFDAFNIASKNHYEENERLLLYDVNFRLWGYSVARQQWYMHDGQQWIEQDINEFESDVVFPED